MSGVIYADVLIVINVYITYFLLKSTALFSRIEPDRLRLFISSLLGGIYSLTVLLPEKIQSAVPVLRFVVMPLFIFTAFGYSSLKAFLRLCISFLASSFIFAGLMFALWYFACPDGMYFDGSVVYFDISISLLAVLTVMCYLFMKAFERLFRSRAPSDTVFLCDVFIDNQKIRMKAFLDTGNHLHDYFTDKPVIVAYKGIFSGMFDFDLSQEENLIKHKGRLIFCNSIGGKTFLPAFSPEKVYIKSGKCDFYTDKVTVALSSEKIMQGEYDAILPVGLFENNISRKEERESEKTTFTVQKD